ncbi:MAG: AI-2E family transporter [Saprospiraceae bacterium]|nr:AI-2E family transporter [Saprospiraceae bacterium]
MKNKYLSLQRIAHLLVILVLVGYVAYIGKSLLIPLAFGILFAFMLKPVSDKIETLIPYRPLSILLAFLIALIPVLGAISFFSYQFTRVFQDISSITQKLKTGIVSLVEWAQENLNLEITDGRQWLLDNLSTLVDTPIQIIGESLSSSTATVAGLLISALLTFFLLLYRTSFKNFMLSQVRIEERDEANKIMTDIQQVSQKYLFGLLLVILILGILNSVGLWFIGIDYAFFWGFLAAFLAIIPYIGTTLGGIFPFLYAIATTGTFWQPAAVVLLYMSVQSLEGNLITPNVVGSTVKVNPLAAILSLLIGGAFWGISGLILALPLIAILRVVCHHIDALQPVSELLGSELYSRKDIFFEKYDEDRYRLINFLKKEDK